MAFTMNVNGNKHDVDVDGDTPLLWVLRDVLGMTGTKFGCGIAQCGACTVHIDGKPVRSCLLAVGSVGDRAVTTIEGIGATPAGARCKKPGSIWKSSSAAIASPARSCRRRRCSPATPHPDDSDIDAAMAGNICRCGTYVRIRAAIKRAAAASVIGGACMSPKTFAFASVAPRALLKGGLAGGFVLAFHLPVRAAQRAGAAAGQHRRPICAQCLHPHRSFRQDDAGHAAGRDGARRLYRDRDDPGRRARRRFCAGRAGACAAQRQALRQSDLWHSGHRQFQFDPRVLEAAARCRRGGARDAGAGRGGSNGRSIRQAAPPPTARSRTRQAGACWPMAIWRTQRAAAGAAKDSAAQGPERFRADRQAAKRLDTPDKTNGKVVYGIDAMLPGMKFATLAASPVFGGKVAHVDDSAAKKIPGVRQIVVLDDLVAVVGDHMWAAKTGLDALAITWDEGPNARRQFERHLGRSARRQQKGRRRRQIRRRHREGLVAGGQGRRRATSFRSSRTRPWSR